MVALDETTDFACITNETGDPTLDCEIVEYGETVACIEEVMTGSTVSVKRELKL